jgi:tRNA pseudouridine synthase 10
MEDLVALLEGDPRVMRAVSAEVEKRRLCDSCLGRQLGKVDHGANAERGAIMRGMADAEMPALLPSKCSMCEGVVEEYEDLAAEVQHALDGYEWDTFLVGTKTPKRVSQLESDLYRSFPSVWVEAFKAEVNREVGRRVEAATDGEANFDTPDVTVLVDPEFNSVDVQVRSVYIYGRYNKLVRGIPQTRWPCRNCKGRGCEACDGTGQQYETSVEQLVAGPFMEALSGEDHALHGAGREDIDARMLGEGRPFVLEIRKPKRRHWDPEEMEGRVNQLAAGKVEVSDLRDSERSEVVALKDATWEKTYLISFSVEGGITEDELRSAAGQLSGTVVKQRTPHRVSHRRADKERPRTVRKLELVDLSEGKAKVEVRGESGIYGEVVELDVLKVHDKERGE